jgi:N-acetylneuraminate synthase
MLKIVAEIGINHNGDIELCKRLMMLAKAAGCDYAKIQKRVPSLCVPDEQKNKLKDTPWGTMTYLQYKEYIEFNENQIVELVEFAKQINIEFFASVWDIPSVNLMCKYTKIGKIPSALVTNQTLCKYAREKFEILMISTGMCSEEEVIACVQFNPDIVFHTNSQYPSPITCLNLRYISHLQTIFPKATIGYSGHENSIYCTIGAIAFGAQIIERHITLDQKMWGSDHYASLLPHYLFQLVNGCHEMEKACQYNPGPRIVFEGELEKRKTLRGV